MVMESAGSTGVEISRRKVARKLGLFGGPQPGRPRFRERCRAGLIMASAVTRIEPCLVDAWPQQTCGFGRVVPALVTPDMRQREA